MRTEIISNNVNKKTDIESLPLDLQQALKEIVTKEGYKWYNVEVDTFKTDGGSYLAALYEIDIRGETDKGDKETNLFVKYIIPAENEKIMNIDDVYEKESFFYNEIAKIYNDLQNEANVPEEERLNIPKGYEQTNERMIILENMSKKGHQCYSRMGAIPLKLAELTVQQISRFHGLGLVSQKKMPDYFNKKLRNLKIHLNFNKDLQQFVKKQCRTCIENMDDYYKEKIEKFSECCYDKLLSYTEEILPGATIVHGDYRTSNTLYKTENDEIISVTPVDYQLIHYGYPMFDFFYLLFTSTDREFRKNHMEYLKNLYYESLGKFLNYFDMNLHDIISRDEFERRFKERLDLGLIMGVIVLPFCFVIEGKEPKVGEENLSEAKFELDDRAYDRIKGLFDDFIEWGYL